MTDLSSLVFTLWSLLTASPPDRLEATALTWITAVPASHAEEGLSKQTDSQIQQQIDSGESSSRNSSSIRNILSHPHPPPVTSDMADPSLTSPSRTPLRSPLRSPNASLTMSFPFLREGSRVWEERGEQALPRDLPSPLPTKRTRTYSA